MKLHLAILAVVPVLAPLGLKAEETSWIFRPSTYSHSPVTGARVAQYQPEEPAVLRFDPTYQESGYRQNHTSIRAGDGGADNMHIVQTWGAGESIRPYGEWQYPFRPGATPYTPWGGYSGGWGASPMGPWQNPNPPGAFPQPWSMFGPWTQGMTPAGPSGLPWSAPPLSAPPLSPSFPPPRSI